MQFFFNNKVKRPMTGVLKAMFVGLLTFYLINITPFHLKAQIFQPGLPYSFMSNLAKSIPEIDLPSPDIAACRDEDIEMEKMGFNKRVGVSVPANINLIKSGQYEILPNGDQCWRLMIKCKNALALGIYFDDFHLPEGYMLYAYDKNRKTLLGAYTLLNNSDSRFFAIELLPYDEVIIELNAEAGVASRASCNISEISYAYDDIPDFIKSRGSSDECEVNINCPEGLNWQYQKHGVARIYIKQGGGYYWCSGSLINNTLQNNEPFFLTADHCAPTASPDDFAQWIFYFNYEAPGCENPSQDPVPNTMTGAVKLANTDTSGSDFLLVRLNEDVPEYYGPYFNGWSIENVASPNGVTIHHPAGDIKKISTYTQQIQTTQWHTTFGTHWLVTWSQTETNWGVTEGGSSGAPLFDNFGRIIGTLTGGQASCETGGGSGTGPDLPDYYGKFSYSWDQNGSEPSQQLKYWLDPINSGVTSIAGKNANLTAAFQASETMILAGNSIEYTNLSSGLPVLWEWTFEGGDPGFFSGPDPVEVHYAHSGVYDVKLVVSDGFDSDTLTLTNYIQVVGKVYPNPTKSIVNIYIEEELPANVKGTVINSMGQQIMEKQFPDLSYPLISFDLSLLSPGIYTIRLEIKQRYIFARVLLLQH
jgi:hypothetical protein